MSKHGWIQKFKKEKDGWSLTTRKGTVYPCTAEQLLSHILPTLAGMISSIKSTRYLSFLPCVFNSFLSS